MLLVALGLAGASSAQVGGPKSQLVLEDITTTVNAGQVMRLALSMRPAAPPDADLTVSVYNPVDTREELDSRSRGNLPGVPRSAEAFNLRLLPRGSGGAYLVDQTVTADGGPGTLFLRRDGVYPIAVILSSPDGQLLDQLVTFFTYIAEPAAPVPLRVSFVVPLTSDPLELPDGSLDRSVTATIRNRLEPVSALLVRADTAGVPVTVPVRPVTLDDWSRAGRELPPLPGPTLPGSHQYLAGPYSGSSSSLLADATLAPEARRQMAAGRAALAAHGIPISSDVAFGPEGQVGARSLRRLADAGATTFLLDEEALEPLAAVDQALTLARPFGLSAGGGTLRALAADQPLTDRLAGSPERGQPRLHAARIFGELSILYFERPDEPRVLTMFVRPTSLPDATTWSALIGDVARAPFVRAVHASVAAREVPAARTGVESQRALVRNLRGPDPPPPPGVVAALAGGRKRVDALAAMVGPGGDVGRAERLLTIAFGVRSNPNPWLAAIDTIITAITDRVDVVTARSITLAAPDGGIPLLLSNEGPDPLTLTISLDSERLRFPGGNLLTEIVPARLQTIDVPVEALTTGSFTLTILVASPCLSGGCPGAITVEEARVIIRSTRASGLTLVVAGGAILFLLIWWAREFVNPRRRRKAAEQEGVNAHLNPDRSDADLGDDATRAAGESE